ncbi:unnamed protein product [Owenia fusiformis]|nr:unnamed protein product [Owenia fusiformis]
MLYKGNMMWCMRRTSDLARSRGYQTMLYTYQSGIRGAQSGSAKTAIFQRCFNLKKASLNVTRLFMQKPNKFKPRHNVDKLPKEHLMIYSNNLNNYVLWCSLLYYGCAVPPCVYAIYHAYKCVRSGVYTSQDFSFFFMGFVGLSLGALFYLFSKRQLIRIYYDTKKEIFTGIKWTLFMQSRKFTFKESDCIMKAPNAALSFATGNVRIKNNGYLLMPGDFISPTFYNKLTRDY